MLCRMYSEGLGSIMLLLLADCVSSNFFLLSSLHCKAAVTGGPGGHGPQILIDQLILSQPGGVADYARIITNCSTRLSDLPKALLHEMKQSLLPLAFPREFQSTVPAFKAVLCDVYTVQ